MQSREGIFRLGQTAPVYLGLIPRIEESSIVNELKTKASNKGFEKCEEPFLQVYSICLQLLNHVNAMQFKQFIEADNISKTTKRSNLEAELDPSLIPDDSDQGSLVKNLDLLKNKIFNFKFTNKA
jgi:hypothetical protein